MPRFFISYRRADSKTITGRIYDRLRQEFGRRNVFKDVDDIPPGTNFPSVLKEAIAKCDVMLVIIGQGWLSISDDQNQRRLDDPHDFVRLEVEMGLQRGDMQVIPVLVEGADHPNEANLPESLKPLAHKNSVVVRDDPDFHRDMNLLVRHLRHARRSRLTWQRSVVAALLSLSAVLISIVLWTSSRVPQELGSPTGATATPTPPGETLFTETFDTNQLDWDLNVYAYGQARIPQEKF